MCRRFGRYIETESRNLHIAGQSGNHECLADREVETLFRGKCNIKPRRAGLDDKIANMKIRLAKNKSKMKKKLRQ